jgi:predicted transcriptional regulator
MPTTKKPRKEPTVSFSVRIPVSLEAETFAVARKLDLERNAFIAVAISEKVEREKKRAAKAAA